MLDSGEVYSRATTVRYIMWALGAVFLLVALGLGFVMARRLSDPLREVVAVLTQCAEGDFRTSIDARFEKRNDEIGALAVEFNALIPKMRHFSAR